jgi:protein tyrosine phosphatase (PTP) superfamily phosphohydrolase (DUF442 family)
MLNNNLEDLITRYKKYERVKKIKKISLIFLALLGLFAIFKISEPSKVTPEIKEQNDSNITDEGNQTIIKSDEENKTIDKNETNKTKDVINKFGLQMTTQKSTKQQLLENHRKTQSYSSAMALANYFYSKSSYKEAIDWAKVASKINKLKEDPWLIYAKSRNELNESDKAKKALELFLKNNDSKRVKELLDTF